MENSINKYADSKIYAIKSYQTNKYYIGSTTKTLFARLRQHNYAKKRHNLHKDQYSTSYEILQYDDHYIELLENYHCNSKEELRRREGQLIREHKDCLVNTRIDGRTVCQYNIDNKQAIALQKKRYQLENKDALNEYRRQYYLKKKLLNNN